MPAAECPVLPGRRRAVAGVLCCTLALAAAVRGADDNRMQQAAAAIGPRAVAAVHQLVPVMVALRPLEPPAQLRGVNDFYNHRVGFAVDDKVWGQVDHWASPLELLDKGEGDCEDYAIAKYFTLLALGLPASALRLVYVRAWLDDGQVQPHMVLAYYAKPAADPLVLDNLVDEILPATRRADLTPVFSFNSDGLWQGVGGPRAGTATERLSRWREVLAKARREGFL